MKIRGFETVTDRFKKQNVPAILPQRGTKTSAGYDFSTPIDVMIHSHDKVLVWTDVKSYMQEGEVLTLHIRSSMGVKKGLQLANVTGIIDSDYYNNPDNEGNIGICLYNNSTEGIFIRAGERIAQGIFIPFLEADNGNTDDERQGGFGSTNK